MFLYIYHKLNIKVLSVRTVFKLNKVSFCLLILCYLLPCSVKLYYKYMGDYTHIYFLDELLSSFQGLDPRQEPLSRSDWPHKA